MVLYVLLRQVASDGCDLAAVLAFGAAESGGVASERQADRPSRTAKVARETLSALCVVLGAGRLSIKQEAWGYGPG